tara:strand:- start:4488 stop:4793 length:306 start_codon:yes stop_codon:yes gene_type:complete
MVLQPDSNAVAQISDRVIANWGSLVWRRDGILFGVLIKFILSSWVPHCLTSNRRASYEGPGTANLAGRLIGMSKVSKMALCCARRDWQQRLYGGVLTKKAR